MVEAYRRLRDLVGAEVLGLLAEGALVTPGGRVVVEHDKREELPEKVGPLERVDVRRFGDTLAIPAWSRIEHFASTDSVVFAMSDEALMRWARYYRFESSKRSG